MFTVNSEILTLTTGGTVIVKVHVHVVKKKIYIYTYTMDNGLNVQNNKRYIKQF